MATKKKKTTTKKNNAPKVKKTLKSKASPAKKKVVAVKKKVTKPVSMARKSAPVRNKTTKVVTTANKDMSFDPQAFEPKWQAKWEADKLYRAVIDNSKPKHYALTMLPYPSGDLHIGHWYAMTPSDARARFKRMQG